MSSDKQSATDAPSPGRELNDIERMDKQYVFGTWAYQKNVNPTQIVDSEGVYFTDADGNRRLDFSGQLMC